MEIMINMKRMGKRRNAITRVPFHLEHCPATVGELLEETVKTCVKEYRERQENMDVIRFFSREEIADKAAAGKVAFGINYGERQPDLWQALESARQAFEDGIAVIFIDGQEQEHLTDNVAITPESDITFVKMTLLAGRMW